MKTLKVNSVLRLILILAAAMITVTACNQQRPEDTKEAAEDRNDEKFESNKSEKDAQFLVDAASIDLMEVQLSQLAETKATSQEVKDLARMMKDEHGKSLEEVKTLAASKSISIPTSPTEDSQDNYKKLSDKTGNDFDKDFCDMMVKGHRDAIDKYETASTECTDVDLKQFATAKLPALRNHLDHAVTCQERMKDK